MSRPAAPSPYRAMVPTVAVLLVSDPDEPFDPSTQTWDQIVRAHRHRTGRSGQRRGASRLRLHGQVHHSSHHVW